MENRANIRKLEDKSKMSNNQLIVFTERERELKI